MSTSNDLDAVTAEQIESCNATGRTPVVFIHGLWLLPAAGTGGRRLRGGRLRAADTRMAR